MKVFDANITENVSAALKKELNGYFNYEMANKKIFDLYGIESFFDDNDELNQLKITVSTDLENNIDPDRAEYGDFQTNHKLANNVSSYLASKDIDPQVVIEPTCGKGSFIIATLKNFHHIERIIGVEIYKPYVWETKFNIIGHFLNKPDSKRPIITIYHYSVFDFDFKAIAKEYSKKQFLVIGNPPWVTSSKLGSLNSTNLPKKTNFKNHSGLDAITGKGNFDIAEFISIEMLKTFQGVNGNLLLLVKNSVVKNIVFEQRTNNYKIGSIERLGIDSKKEFNVSVEASLFYCLLNRPSEYSCKEYNFYDNQRIIKSFGWLEDKFVSNIDTYTDFKNIDGISPFVWRQGLKHDCSSIMEFEQSVDYYVNGLHEKIELEEDLVYGLLKSSDLKNTVIIKSRKSTIVTQKKVGQDTSYIKHDFPKTYKYLKEHISNFEARKSSIYKNKPLFSIFGIGEYSFKPFKVAISGLYKSFHFTLVLPQNDKPVMLDDTCYLIGFDKIEFAVYSLILLNSELTVKFFQSITFSDAKRVFTKDILMRVDLLGLAERTTIDELSKELKILNEKYSINIDLHLWQDFLNTMKPSISKQIEIAL